MSTLDLTLEKDIETKLVRLIERHGGRCLKWVCPGWLGVPDRLCLLPGGRIFFVETKRPKGGKYSKMQNKWRDWLQELGFWYLRVHNSGHLQLLELLILDDVK